KVLNELEKWASELSYQKCILETGWRQPDAIRLYEKNGYKRISNYGKYAGIENSVCFEKNIPGYFFQNIHCFLFQHIFHNWKSVYSHFSHIAESHQVAAS